MRAQPNGSKQGWAKQAILGCAYSLILTVFMLGFSGSAVALTPSQALELVQGDNEARLDALAQALRRDDAALPAFIKALLADEIKLVGPEGALRVVAVRADGVTADATTQAVVPRSEPVQDVPLNNRLRRAYQGALAGLDLLAPDLAARKQAAAHMKDDVDASKLALIERALSQEADATLKAELASLKARASLTAEDKATRMAAAQSLAAFGDPGTRALLMERASQESDSEVKAVLATSLIAVNQQLQWGERLGLLFTGISLGSILLLAALGLAITYGLMGVINMAHGELIMIGAYATYVVQNLFRTHFNAAFDAYVWLAIPASFLTAAAVGVVMERTVIRWLYGRPLETLLATWGISLMLMQGVRSLFGAQNVPVENPAWLSGGLQVLPNLTLPYNRLALIAFVALVLMGVSLLMSRTRLGLFVRGVTQNRPMAACVGVNTARVDTYAFALGAGLAGLAGCALAQIGNVGPDLGQTYIVDSFMVVVLGGVGQLAGTVVAALSLGVLNKVFEGFAGAVLAKIMVLVLIVVFIQKRPQGLFALKGRSAEA
jgi:urea transport system permease protein